MDSKKYRLSITIMGLVQGIGFRPFVYNLAKNMNLTGTVMNNSQGVFIEAEGSKNILDEFIERLQAEKPHLSFIQNFQFSFLEPKGYKTFEILESNNAQIKSALVLPDIATCNDCVNEIFDPQNRRYLYPFTNCTLCGPRFSIIEKLPYDRENTSMKTFSMCPECMKEYKDPKNRRFHAQPNACAKCGPRLQLYDNLKNLISEKENAFFNTILALKSGKIIAIKGIGGYQLICDAHNESAIRLLRNRKNREKKPFAIMSPSLAEAEKICTISQTEKIILTSPHAPIVLLEKKDFNLYSQVAPDNPYLGIMLPYSPLHHMIMKEFASFIIATSANLAEEPICIDENSAFERLRKIADLFLVHNRPIVRQVDDSIIRILSGKPQILRRARGYAPLPIFNKNIFDNILSTGAQQKNSFSFSLGGNIFTSQHIGDLDSYETMTAFKREIKSLFKIFDFNPQYIVSDNHPDYESTKWAQKNYKKIIRVGHHISHVFSCMAENEISPPLLGVSWDGTGLGDDGTVWGGEFFGVHEHNFKRVAHIKTFKLPGGEKAIKEPRRSAVGVLWEIYGKNLFGSQTHLIEKNFNENELIGLETMLKKEINSPLSSSMGRVFDAVSSLLNLNQINNFEGEAAMMLEFSIKNTINTGNYEFELIENSGTWVIDWRKMILGIIEDISKKHSISSVSAKFHNTLAEMIVTIAKKYAESKIILTGGCFQNKYLTEKTTLRLQEEGFNVFFHQKIPPNDGGISLGQAYLASKIILKG